MALMTIYWLIISSGKKPSTPGWASLTGLYSILAGAVVVSSLDAGGFASKITLTAVGHPQIVVGCWLDTSIPSHVDLSIAQLTVWRLNPFRVSECENRRGCPGWKLQSFYNLVLEVTFHHFCHIVFVRNESIKPTHTQRVDYTRVHSNREMGIKLGPSQRLHLPTIIHTTSLMEGWSLMFRDEASKSSGRRNQTLEILS